jgi:hypothetical protein
MSSCGVIIPAYQAEAHVGDVVRRCRVQTEVAGVIVVDDGSADATGDAAHAAGARLLTHLVNRGKGAALMTGFREASALGWEAAITLDADGQHDPNDIPRFIAESHRTRADIVVGARARASTPMPLPRRLSNRLSSAVVSRLAGTPIPDSQSGYRLVARRVWELLPLSRVRYDFESEILIRAARHGYVIVSLPIETHYADEKSHFRPFRDTARMIGVFWSLFREGQG